MASRKRYCGHVVAKLQQRADLRHAGRAFQCWLEHYQEQQARQQVGTSCIPPFMQGAGWQVWDIS